MRALWLVRDDLERHPGGDTTQILRTAGALRELGHSVDLRTSAPADAARYDVAHLFHLDRLWENRTHAAALRTAGIPTVLSTIYWPADEYDRGGRAGWQGRLARIFGSAAYQDLRYFQRAVLQAIQQRRMPPLSLSAYRFRTAVRELLACVAVLLPNSRAEGEAIAQRFGKVPPVVVVPNAADATYFGPPPSPAPARGGVLCVGRLEARKNQLALLAALRDTDIPLTFIGQAGRFAQDYERRCRAAAWPGVTFVAQQPPAALARHYHSAAVHACVSWYETPGLASLEAALCGCALVVTPGGCTREYFGDAAHYGQPDDPASLRRAVLAALAAGPAPQLAQRVAGAYTWQAAAAQTAAGYELACSASPAPANTGANEEPQT